MSTQVHQFSCEFDKFLQTYTIPVCPMSSCRHGKATSNLTVRPYVRQSIQVTLQSYIYFLIFYGISVQLRKIVAQWGGASGPGIGGIKNTVNGRSLRLQGMHTRRS